MFLENISLGVAVGLVALAAASVSDIRTREVPDWLSFSLIFFAVGYAAMLSVYHGTSGFIVNSLIGLFIGLGVGMFMFYTGQWGGGDSKLIMGISAIFGFAIPGISRIHGDYELLIFMINALFVGAAYGLTYSFWNAIVHIKSCRDEAKKLLGEKRIRMARVFLLGFLVLAGAAYFFKPGPDSAIVLGISIAATAIFYAWILVSSVEKVHMIRDVKVSELTEGDWVVNSVTKNGKAIFTPSKTGISLEEIAMLKKNNVRSVTIKIGIPFIPSFFIAYIITIVFGNWFVGLLTA